MNKPHRLLLFCSYCLIFFVRIVKMPNSITFILGLSLSDWIESECASVPAFLNTRQENGPLIPIFEIFTFCPCMREEDGNFFKCFVPVPFGPPLCFWQNQSLQSKLLRFPTGNKWENPSSLWKCSLLWRLWWAQLPEPCTPTPQQEFLGVTLNPELQLPWQPASSSTHQENCLSSRTNPKKSYEVWVKSFKFSRAQLIFGAHRLLVYTDMLLWCR